MIGEPKGLCINCTSYSDTERECYHYNNVQQSLVTGKLTHNYSADFHRARGIIGAYLIGFCGERGRWFKRRE